MHFNRKKITKPKLKISAKGKKKKKTQKVKKIKYVSPVIKINKKRGKIRSSILPLNYSKLNDNVKYKPLQSWNNLLRGETAFILGNSPSIAYEDLELLNPYFTIGVNRIFYIYDPTVLIWQDIQMWITEKNNIIKQKAIKICSDIGDPKGCFLNFTVKERGFRIIEDMKSLYGTGNTTALAAQVAINLGCSNLVLLGTDCRYGPGKKTDFYGKNKDHKSYTLSMCMDAMYWLRENSPIPIYNCSKNKLWPRQELSKVIKQLKLKKRNRKKYLEIFKI